MKQCKNLLWCPCFLEGAEQFHWRNSSTFAMQQSYLFYNFCTQLILSNGQNKRILAISALINMNGGTVPLLLLARMAEQFHFCFQQVWRNSSTFAFSKNGGTCSTFASSTKMVEQVPHLLKTSFIMNTECKATFQINFIIILTNHQSRFNHLL